MLRLFIIFVTLGISVCKSFGQDRVFTGYFSRQMKIDSSTIHCGAQQTGLYFMFQSLQGGGSGNTLLYALIKCPETFDADLFNYQNRLRIYYRESTRADLENLTILNRHKYFNLVNLLITRIELDQ